MDNRRAHLLRDGYVILRQVVPPEQLDRLRSDIETVVERQRASEPAWGTTPQPRASISEHVDAETLSAFAFVLHDNTYGVSARLLDCPDETVSANSALVLCNPEFTPNDPQYPGQPWGTDPRNWHRDMRPDRDGPLSALLEDQLANGPGYVQWNIPLYEDHILHVVPGSHRRLTDQAEASHLHREGSRLTPLPVSQRVELGPGDGVAYNNLILHWGSKYSPEKKRRTILLSYRSFGRILPHQRCNLPVGFWNRFSEDCAQRTLTERWRALFHGEFATIEEMFRAVLLDDGEKFLAGLARLHPPAKGRLACLILLSKIALAVQQKNHNRGNGTAVPKAGKSLYDWHLEKLAEHFSGEELEQLWQRFEPVDEALRGEMPRHVSGFLGPTTVYEFEKIPAGMTPEGLYAAILGRS